MGPEIPWEGSTSPLLASLCCLQARGSGGNAVRSLRRPEGTEDERGFATLQFVLFNTHPSFRSLLKGDTKSHPKLPQRNWISRNWISRNCKYRRFNERSRLSFRRSHLMGVLSCWSSHLMGVPKETIRSRLFEGDYSKEWRTRYFRSGAHDIFWEWRTLYFLGVAHTISFGRYLNLVPELWYLNLVPPPPFRFPPLHPIG